MLGIYLFDSFEGFEQIFQKCKSWGIKWIFTLPHIYSKNNFQNNAKKYGIKNSVIFPVYYDKEYLETNPNEYSITSKGRKAIHDWLHFACQSSIKYIEMRKKKLKDLLKHSQPDMIAIDFIRFYVFWEEVYPNFLFEDIEDGCYCPRCINQFQNNYNINIKNKNPQWIKKSYLEQ